MQANALTVIHKFIRNELFKVSRRLACADPADPGDVRDAIEALAVTLRTHEAEEDASLEIDLRAADTGLAARMAADHQRLDDELERICLIARALEGTDPQRCAAILTRLHLDWNRFVSAYLAHLDDEERVLFPTIAAHLPPLEAVAQDAVRDPRADEFLRKLASMLTPHERAAIEQARGARGRQLSRA